MKQVVVYHLRKKSCWICFLIDAGLTFVMDRSNLSDEAQATNNKFIKRNIEIAKDAHSAVPMTDAEKLRIAAFRPRTY